MSDDVQRGILGAPRRSQSSHLPDEPFAALTDGEQAAFEYLQAVVNGEVPGTRVALMRVWHEGTNRAVIAAVADNDSEVMVWPLALMIDDMLFDRIEQPTGGERHDTGS